VNPLRVLVTRPSGEAEAWVAQLRDRGFDAIALPLIRIQPSPNAGDVEAGWERLAHSNAVMFVSGNAVRHFFARRPAGAAWPLKARAWATGTGTRHALMHVGVPESSIDSPSADAPQFDSEALWREVAAQVKPGSNLLLVRGGDAGKDGDAGRDWLASRLLAAGAQVHVVVAYLRGVPDLGEGRRHAVQGATDGAWLFSSSQAIHNLQALLPDQDWQQARAVCTHPRIAQAASAAGFGVVCESRPAVDAVAAALESFR
jgi:uroporphyrinogen-III synthase